LFQPFSEPDSRRKHGRYSIIKRGAHGQSAALQDVGVYHGGFDVFVAEEFGPPPKGRKTPTLSALLYSRLAALESLLSVVLSSARCINSGIGAFLYRKWPRFRLQKTSRQWIYLSKQHFYIKWSWQAVFGKTVS
jgi:hypothetical protein